MSDKMKSSLFPAMCFLMTLGAWGEAFSAIPAFPGAEGGGAYAIGGRGGRVIEVTNLNDKGPGSLREAVDAKGPRIVVFRVSGNIELKRPIEIRNPYITIAGQTAPGDGICLQGSSLKVEADDVIVRYLRSRPGDVSGKELDAISGTRSKNIIIDHCSASWSVDECLSFCTGTENTTIQWCLISESLTYSVHHKGRHGYGGIWGGMNATFHHNLLAHHTSRNPRFSGEMHTIDHRNNVIYNWGFNSCYGNEMGKVNMIGNYYKPGPATEEECVARILQPNPDKKNNSWVGRYYLGGNYMVGSPEVTADNWKGVYGDAPKEIIRLDKPIPAAPVTTHSAEEAYKLVLAGAGANFPKRDALDERVIEEVRTGTAKYGRKWGGGGKGIIDSQEDVGGWPRLKSAQAPLDSDHDGMPDVWEKPRGLNPKDAKDAAMDHDGDGYTNVEEYINGLVSTQTKPP